MWKEERQFPNESLIFLADSFLNIICYKFSPIKSAYLKKRSDNNNNIINNKSLLATTTATTIPLNPHIYNNISWFYLFRGYILLLSHEFFNSLPSLLSSQIPFYYPFPLRLYPINCHFCVSKLRHNVVRKAAVYF